MSEEYIEHCKRCHGPGTWRDKKPYAYMGIHRNKSIFSVIEKPRKQYLMQYVQTCKCGMILHTTEIHDGTCPKELRNLKASHR
jgi:hypothetical protein